MEQTGMRWTVEGAQAMLHVRALDLDEQGEEFHEHRVERVKLGWTGGLRRSDQRVTPE